MKILFAMAHIGIFRHLEGVVRELSARGHTVHVLRSPISKTYISERALEACEAECPRVMSGWLIRRQDIWARPLRELREIASYAGYLQPGHPSPHLRERWLGHVSPRLRPFLRTRVASATLADERVRSFLRTLQRVAPPDRTIVDWLRAHSPDVVVSSPFIFAHSLEPDYIKAAQVLGIPTAVAIASWDNLTTKGIFPLMPDVTMVWNDDLAEELVMVHGVPRERIVVTGAPVFDQWFRTEPRWDFRSFCIRTGLDPTKPFILYLCSSKFIANDEVDFVRRFAAAVCDVNGKHKVQLLVRPHPNHSAIWGGARDQNLVVWPRTAEVPDTPEARQQYFDSLYHSAGVVGVNTSALIDAAVVDRPCLTILSSEYHRTQRGIGHFRHLAAGGFLEQAVSLDEAACLVQRVVDGHDRRGPQRRQFVRRFIRPWGMDVPAERVVASAIATLAAGAPITSDRLVHLAGAQYPASAPPTVVTPSPVAGGRGVHR